MLNAWLSFLKDRYGDEAVGGAIGKLAPQDKLQLEKTILDSSWYPIEATRVLSKLQSVLDGKVDISLEMGRYMAEYVFTGVYRMFLTRDPLSQGKKIVQASNYFYRDVHKLEVDVTGPVSCTVRYRLAKGKPSIATCNTRKGWWARALELAGAISVNITHPQCRARGQEVCEFLVEWSAQSGSAHTKPA
jgi:predicted hydrocarbon binding protein